MAQSTYEPKSKTLTSYRRMILRKYNSKPLHMTEMQFSIRHKIPLGELQFWQQLAGQELNMKLKEMTRAEDSITTDDQYTFAKF